MAPAPSPFAAEDILSYLPRTKAFRARRGELIYSAAMVPSALYLVDNGAVALVGLRGEQRAVKRICFREEFFGEALFTACASEQAEAIEDTTLQHWPAPVLRDLMERDPGLSIAFCQELTRRCLEYGGRIVDLASQPVASQLATLLLVLSEKLVPDGVDTSVQFLPHKILAQYLGTSREVVTHYLNEFRRQGLLLYSRKTLQIDRGAIESRFGSLTAPAEQLSRREE